MNKLEQVQVWFTIHLLKCYDYKCRPSYTARLKILNLEPLEARRIKFDLIIFAKIFLKTIDCHLSSLLLLNNNCNRKKHCFQIKYLDKKYDDTFICRSLKLWNNLPQNAFNNCNLDSPIVFVNNLKNNLKSSSCQNYLLKNCISKYLYIVDD